MKKIVMVIVSLIAITGIAITALCLPAKKFE